MVICLVLSFACVALLAFMILAPSKWGAIVEKENGFWVKKGLVKASTAEKFIRFEKGKGLKVLLLIPILLTLFLWIYIEQY